MTILVLLPGLGGTGELFEPFVAALGSAVATKIIRYPGDEALGYDALTAFVRDALPVGEPFVLIGESFSGPIAISLAAEGHAQLRGLVLCCSFARNPRPLLGSLGILLPLLPVVPRPLGLLAWLLMGRLATDKLRQSLARALGQLTPRALEARLWAVMRVDVSAELHRIAVPILYLHATGDRVVPKAALDHICALKPDTRVVSVPAPHFLLQTKPAAATQAVLDFIRQGSLFEGARSST
jgi:pimeloyl-ACP methyl ester carboxylesterase